MSAFFLGKSLLLLFTRSLLVVAAINVSNIHFSTLRDVEPTRSASLLYAHGPLPFDVAGQATLLEVYNTGRANVNPPATNMNKVVWSSELALTAATALESCIYRISVPQHTTIQLTSYSDIDVLLSDRLTEWYTFGEYYDYHQKSCKRPDIPIVCEIYKLLVWSSMTAVGCSQHFCEYLWNTFSGVMEYDKLYWKCNYENVGFFTDASTTPYQNGTSVTDSCSQCESGAGWCSDRLCDSECDLLTARCTCALDPLCSGNGVLNHTTCECSCNGSWVGNSCEDCNSSCQANEDLDLELCQCVCQSGFQTNQTSLNCEDIDECQAPYDCDQICVNTPGSYNCTCVQGFSLSADGHTCVSLSPHFKMPQAATLAGTMGVTTMPESVTTEGLLTESATDIAKASSTEVFTTDTISMCSLGFNCSGKGIPDNSTCECNCASGYKGNTCNEKCLLNDSSCWREYEEPPAVTDADYCPRYCPDCVCNQSENNCSHNGTYSKIAGYELQHGMCRCYCPFPWSGLTCEDCYLSCANGGTLDPDVCSCTCPAGFRPPDCSGSCTEKSKWCTGRLARFCDRVPAIRQHCPVMCGSCSV